MCVSVEEKNAVLDICVPAWSTPSQSYIDAIHAGHNPTINELIELCGVLHDSQIRVNNQQNLSELDYQTFNFEEMQDFLVSAQRKLQDALRVDE